MRPGIRHILFLAVIFLILQAAIGVPVYAAVSGTADIHPRLVRLGGTFQVTLTIESDKSLRFQNVDFPVPDGVTFNDNFISDGQSVSHAGSREQFTYTKTRIYSADEVGEYEIGPFRINYDTDEDLGREILIEPLTIEVYDDAPRPASAIIFGERTVWWKYLIIPGLLAVLAGLIWAWVAMKRGKSESPVKQTISTVFKSPEQIAVDKVKALEIPKADDIAMVREYYDAVDEILREYLAARFEINIVDATSYEIRMEFTRRQRIDARAGGVLNLINDCDWVKFAKSYPSQPEIEQIPARVARTLIGK